MPWFSPLYYQQYHETYGYTPEEIYPQILFQGNLPLNEDQLTRGNAWLEANRKVLPRELQDLQYAGYLFNVTN